MRRFGDHDATRDAIYSNAMEAFQALPPVENSRYRMTFSDPGWAGPAVPSVADHKAALLTGRTLGRRLTATVGLVDKASGATVDSRRMTVASVPQLSRQGTFVIDGNPSALSHQLRLLPGAFVRRKASGETSTHFNFLPGQGVPHQVVMDPATGVFRTHVGQAEIPTVTLLRAFGATDDDLKKYWGDWGPEIVAANLRADKPHHLARYWEKFGAPGPPPPDLAQALAARLSGYKMDPWVTRRTLGHPHAAYGKLPLLAATRKMIAVNRGEADPDDRDNPAYSAVWGPEHLIAERIARAGPHLAKHLWQVTNAGSLKRLQPGFLTPAVRGVFTHSGLALAPEGVSAAEYVDHGARITKVGEGGIGKSAESVPMSARAVSPGQFPFIDSIRTSECFDAETEVFTARGWLKWPDVNEADELACWVAADVVEFHRPEKLVAYTHDGPLCGVKDKFLNYLVTPNHRMWVRPSSGRLSGSYHTLDYSEDGWRFETADEVNTRPYRQFVSSRTPIAGDETQTHFTLGGERYAIEDWAELVGWITTEGHVTIYRGEQIGGRRITQYRVRIAQSVAVNPTNTERISSLLSRLGFNASYHAGSSQTFVFYSKSIAEYFVQFGTKANNKRLPDVCFGWPLAARRRLFDALVAGDGCTRASGFIRYGSASGVLVEQLLRLATSLGISSRRATTRPPARPGYSPYHVCSLFPNRSVFVVARDTATRRTKYVVPYVGTVYCATVVGGRLLVRRGGGVPIWTGNSESVGVDLRVAFGTRLGSDKNIYAPLLDGRTGKLVFKSPRDLADATVAFPGALQSGDPVVPAVRGGRLTHVPRHEVDYHVPSMEQSFSPLTNMVPIKSASKPHRSSMGARMISQSLPLTAAEPPLVRTQVPNQPGRSFEELFGRHMGAVFARADQPGVVESVAPGGVTVRYADGRRETHELYDNHPSGRKTALTNEPLVRPGQQVTPGQILAKSNYTDHTGTAAYGKNLRTAFMIHNSTYEDSIGVSASAAEKLRSDHLYRHTVQAAPDVVFGREAHAAAFPGKHPLSVLKQFGADGVIKPGAVVNHGDPLILAVRRKAGDYGRLSRSGKAALSDASETWEHEEPGVVTDVVQTWFGPSVVVKTTKRLQDGDKLCYDPETEILTVEGWKPVAAVTPTDTVASLDAGGRLEYLQPTSVHAYPYSGRMYCLDTTQVSLRVTPDHHLLARPRNQDGFRLLKAEELYAKRFELKADAEWVGDEPKEFELPGSSYTRAVGRGGKGTKVVPPEVMKTETYLLLLGAFLTDGYTIYDPKAGNYGLGISQVKPDHRDRLRAALTAAGVKFVERPERFLVYSRGLAEHLRPYGKTATKYVPPYVFGWSPRLIRVLLDWLNWGNGSLGGSTWSFSTGSCRLVGDYQRLCLHAGWASHVKLCPAADKPDTVKGVPVKTKSDSYQVYIYRHKLTPEINHGHAATQGGQHERWEDYTGTVYCVTLPRNHTLYVRRNGKTIWSGNSGRHGNKGVVVITPDDEMPRDAQGRPVEVIISSLGTISRTNPSAIFEAHLGKIAEKTGKPYVFDDFAHGRDVGDYVRGEAARHGVPFMETLTDPKTGRPIPNVGVGMLYVMKLHHLSAGKAKGRGLGGYDESGQPLRGQSGKAMRASMGDTNALVSHGACFMGSVHVTTEHGDLEISSIVNNRLSVRVACATPDGQVVYRPVTNWFCRVAEPGELLRVETGARSGSGQMGGRQVRCAIRCTANHEFYTPDGKMPARDLVPGTVVYTVGTMLQDWQLQLMMGGLMGDSYGPKTFDSTSMKIKDRDLTRARTAVRGGARMSHGIAQREYLLWKAEKVSNLWTGTVNTHQGGYSNTVKQRVAFRKHPETTALIDEFYVDGQKRVPAGIVARMGWLGIGIWFADDGSCVCPRGSDQPTAYRFHTNGFTWSEAEQLAVELSAFCGLVWGVTPDSAGRPILHLNNGGRGGNQLDEWARRVAPYVPPMMGYKIRNRFPVGEAWASLVADTHPTVEPVEVASVTPYTKTDRESYCVYDITVDEHHNYFAGGIQVSNSKVLHDAHIFRGQDNPEFWASYMAGFPPVKPHVSKPFERFLSELRAAGIDPVHKDGRYHLTALTDEAVRRYAGDREVTSGETLDLSRDGRPVEGGLHDPKIFGTTDSQTQWGKVTLHEPVVSPVFEEPVRRLLGLTGRQFRDVVSGKHALPSGATGMAGLVAALRAYDVPGELAKARRAVESTRKTVRDDAARRLKYLAAMERTGTTPADWVTSAVPVLPPGYRPVNPGRGGGENALVHDQNYLYADLINANHALRDLSKEVDDVGAERLNLYDAVAAAYGLGDPVGAKNRERGVRGVLARLLGDSGKHSFMQQKLLGTPVNLSGRAAALPDMDLDMDQIGVPHSVAWDVYHPFVVRRLVRSGVPRVEAVRQVADRAPAALRALQAEMGVRPILATRYPALHRYAVQAFRPTLAAGDAVMMNHLVTKSYGGDFDGDTYTLSVPLTDEAVAEAYEKMLPSKNLFSPAGRNVLPFLPNMEVVQGHHALTTGDERNAPVEFRTLREARAAEAAGLIGLHTRVRILEDG